MNSKWTAVALIALMAFGGCRAAPRPPVSMNQYTGPGNWVLRSETSQVHSRQVQKSQNNDQSVRQVGFEQSKTKSSNASRIQDSPSDIPIQPVVIAPSQSNGYETSLEQLEQMALATSPAVAEVQAEIESLRGKLLQAGLPPNPTAGINGEDINEDGGPGRYGVYFGREIVRGNKLGLSRSAVCAEIVAAEQRLAVVEQRLLTDVRQRYYDLLVAQETIAMTGELVKISQDAVDVSKQLFAAKEAARTSVLQSELELQNAMVVNRQAENQLLGARRKLAALLGEADLPNDNVAGNARDILELEDFEQSYEELVNTSPEVAALFAEVQQKRRQLARECVEAIPNVTWQTTLQYGAVNDELVGGFQVGMPIPTLNRNQGAIYQARYEIAAAERRTEKKVLDLRQRLATAYEIYLDARLQVDAYESEILPKAQETKDLVTKGYQQGEIDFLQLLTAQRTYSQINLTYLEQLQLAWRQNVEIKGMLLSGSLE